MQMLAEGYLAKQYRHYPLISSMAEGKTRVDHYVSIINKRIADIKVITHNLPVDGYFMKKEFILPITKARLNIITKARSNANLMYLYKSEQKKGKGRKKVYDGKINTQKMDWQRLPCSYADDQMQVYSGFVYFIWQKKIDFLEKLLLMRNCIYKHKPQR
jgi:hypothetical protein